MSILSGLRPSPVWTYFEDICKIPRLSKNEEKIRKYLLDFALENNLESKEDIVGNILIVKPASQGFEKIKTVVLQSHMDMVGEKNADHPHDWSEDPIKPVVDNEWVMAQGTTLGADDGIGLAAQLAILSDKNLKSGRIECLFTVDEESGMTGAVNLRPDFFTGKILINLDSEDEGILYIGCAGGIDTVGIMPYNPLPVEEGSAALEIAITGLHGGHSGDEIHKGYGNSVKIMNRFLWNLSNNYDISLSSFNGGNLRNAIPREAFATIVVQKPYVEQVINWIDSFYTILLEEFGDLEKDLKVSVKEADLPGHTMDDESQRRLLNSLTCCPHGAIAWSKEMDNLVETSTNLASVKFIDNYKIEIVTTQRSSIESSKYDVAAMVESCLGLAGAEVTHSEGYPGWRPNINSEILKITQKSYRKLFGREPDIRAIHAGLECGLIYKKFKGIDMISIGPTIRGAHTPEEKIEIKTTQMFWDLLIDVLNNIPHQE
ncbi:MAG TPA: aminoacyl-histidine dipeptidase [Bacteroidales bacterium]|jgi:dipeptidase D|nr:beta-Ala-His dipeptidase [Bacteroidales bacterium]OQB63771.1 MAG: Cytosol non-specific dipeptidase [Bacteroidetes bacterium ADurb.Bin145]NMD02710.1 aminoacyl-histidine dipeptidase [Bacteroidales bacterium]HOU02914.1 aminoacyl-histidine dipeptidase [Bacteroidales bacterium]HQG63802.1 aminoacyl-histidine dipeptidase [Bacteroidales bacterium]